jgi:hypothetical protein
MSEISRTPLCDFRDRVLAKQRIGKGDVRALRRELLADGIATREEASLLLALDRAVASVHPSWTGFLAAAVVDFVVWGSRPTGHVDEDTGGWLVAALAGDGGPTRRARRIADEVVREAGSCPPRLAAFALAGAAPADAAGSDAERLAA